MRIIAGSKRGMKLFIPKGLVSRPVTDRVKESLFSVLYKYDLPEGKMVADVFSGVGSVGLEALSRGAQFVVFVEKDYKTITLLKKNIEKAGFAEVSKVVRADATKVAAPVDFGRDKYDWVSVDPPFAMVRQFGPGSPIERIMELLPGQLAPGGIVTVRTNKAVELADEFDKLEIIDRRVWGINAVTIFRLKEDDEQASGN